MGALAKHHEQLSEKLLGIVAKELFELQSEPVYSQQEIVAWLVGAEPPVFTAIEESMEGLIGAHRIKLKRLTFRRFDEADLPHWLGMLGKLKNIHFERCVFQCGQLPLGGTAVWFERCRFGKSWAVTMGKNPEALMEPGDPLYNDCRFAATVSLRGHEIDEETLGLYDIVFENCKMKSLYVAGLTLNARLYRGFQRVPDLFNPDRHGAPNDLDDFLAISTVFKKEFNLSCLHIQEAHISSCIFEDVVNLSSFVCERLNFDSCNMNSRVDIGHVHAKNVSVRDCHFKRSVIFDFSAMDVLLFNTSSFEQILSLEYSEIGDCIAISSCAMGKPPNFLNCRLADDAIQNADRETFRIIKNAFDGVGNNIEANRYFSYEMNAYLKELRQSSKGHRAERWLLELNRAISDHGQNYWKPLLFIFPIPILYWLASIGYEEQWLYGSHPKLDWVLSNVAQFVNQYAAYFSALLPKNNAEGFEFIALFLAMMLSTFVWHFLVAVRRHKRR